ncbi:MAG: hypothetical protein AB7S46_18065 [Flavobacteriaceae bacterium]
MAQPRAPKSAPPKRWATKLTRRIVVRKGPHDWLLSLDDARLYILKHLQDASDPAPVEKAVDLLVHAAGTGRLADREAATAQMERALRGRGWL